MIEGKYKFNIWKEDGFYLAYCYLPDGNRYMTQGRTEEEIFEMIADLYLCMYDIEISRWKRFIFKLFRL